MSRSEPFVLSVSKNSSSHPHELIEATILGDLNKVISCSDGTAVYVVITCQRVIYCRPCVSCSLQYPVATHKPTRSHAIRNQFNQAIFMDRLSITSSHCAAQQEDVNETQQARVEDVARDFHTERLIESHCYSFKSLAHICLIHLAHTDLWEACSTTASCE